MRRTLNGFMALGSQAWTVLRRRLSELLRADTPLGKRAAAVQRDLLVPQDDAVMQLPVRIGDYSDFYASLSHASNVGSMLRPDNPLLPNYKWVPIGYHGRASSIVVSGHAGATPAGQSKGRSAMPHRPSVPPSASTTRSRSVCSLDRERVRCADSDR